MVVYPDLCARSIVSNVSASVPIWFTLMRMELPTPSSMPRVRIFGLVTNRSSPTSCTLPPSLSLPRKLVGTGLVELRGSRVQGERHLLVQRVTAPLNGLRHQS